MKKILNIDSPTRIQTKKALDNYWQEKNNLVLPQHLAETCQGCGRIMAGKKRVTYFEQEFCHECVEKWKSGEL